MSNEQTNSSTAASAIPLAVEAAAPHIFVKKIGNTTFDIHIHFSQTSKETFADKVLRLIQNDAATN